MGLGVIVMGNSGCGKSASIRNYKAKECVVFEVAGKALPFRTTPQFKACIVNTSSYEVIEETIKKSIEKSGIKTYIVDDSQFLMAFENFDKAKEKGYDKYVNMALHFQQFLRFIETKLPNDVIVFLLHHTETNELGFTKMKTLGKMLDNQLTVDSLFTIILLATKVNKRYVFQTKDDDGVSTIKTPIGMFEETYIDNDLKLVEKTIRDYYNIETTNESEAQENEKN